MKLLDKSRKLNKLLQQRDTAQYQEIANLMSDIIDANVYIVGNKGDVKAYSLREEFACKIAKEVVLDNGNFPAEYVQFLIQIVPSEATKNACLLIKRPLLCLFLAMVNVWEQ